MSSWLSWILNDNKQEIDDPNSIKIFTAKDLNNALKTFYINQSILSVEQVLQDIKDSLRKKSNNAKYRLV